MTHVEVSNLTELQTAINAVAKKILQARDREIADVMAHFRTTLSRAALDQVIHKLIDLLKSRKPCTRQRLAAALKELGQPAVFEIQVKLATARGATFRLRLIEALGAIGRAGEQAALGPLLFTWLYTRDVALRQAAQQALKGAGIHVPIDKHEDSARHVGGDNPLAARWLAMHEGRAG